jgi:hypothetical protein
MFDYLFPLAPVFGAKLAVKSGTVKNIEEGWRELQKRLYINGAEWHQYIAYEYDSDTRFIPGFTIANDASV